MIDPAEQQSFFQTDDDAYAPLAARMRPETLDNFFGQPHLLSEGKPLYEAIKQGRLHSMILWGPPGTGKTTLAHIIAHRMKAKIERISAVLAGVKDVRAIVEKAKLIRQQEQRSTILFVDEVHRFNKSQQDAFLPHVEEGLLTLIGATTENPSFALNNALLSRARVYVLKRLSIEAILAILKRALPEALIFPEEQLQRLAQAADGDARSALNLLQLAIDLSPDNTVSEDLVDEVLKHNVRQFDKQGDIFYDQISALHKSVRGSSPDAALYWLCRMLDGGCDPLYIARRVLRMASEDIGNADPRALQLALDAWEVQERLGSPEGELALAQAVIYLAAAPKSNAVYMAFKRGMQAAKLSGFLPVPMHLRNAPTALMKGLGHGKDYRYAHDEPDAYAAGENYFPDEMPIETFYEPVERGLEIKIAEKLRRLREKG